MTFIVCIISLLLKFNQSACWDTSQHLIEIGMHLGVRFFGKNGSLIQDCLDHTASKEPINPLWERIIQYF